MFLFDTAFHRGVDHIIDFSGKDDIALDKDIFSVLPLGRLANSAFAYGSDAADPSVRILYDLGTGVIRYDADGNGGRARGDRCHRRQHGASRGRRLLRRLNATSFFARDSQKGPNRG